MARYPSECKLWNYNQLLLFSVFVIWLQRYQKHTHTTVLRPSWILSGTTLLSRHQTAKTRKVKPISIYWSKMMSGSGISSAIWKSAHWPGHTPPLSFYRPIAIPAAQPAASKHWRQFQRYQKGKRFWSLMKQEIMQWQFHQLDYMQIISTLLRTDNHASTALLTFFICQMLFQSPSQQCQSCSLCVILNAYCAVTIGWVTLVHRWCQKLFRSTRNCKLSTGTIMAHHHSRSKHSCHSLDLVLLE